MTALPPAHPRAWARPFFTIWTGQAFSLLGSALVQFALVWWLTQKTGSAAQIPAAIAIPSVSTSRGKQGRTGISPPQSALGPWRGLTSDRRP